MQCPAYFDVCRALFYCEPASVVVYSVLDKVLRPAGSEQTGCVDLGKINDFFISHGKLTLALMWICCAVAVGLGAFIAICYPGMAFLKFFGIIIVPALLAFYFRMVYIQVQDDRRKAQAEEKTAANEERYHHKKKKRI